MEGEQNVGGWGDTAAKEFSQFNWFTNKIFQNEIMLTNRGWLQPYSTDPFTFVINKNHNDWIKINRTLLWGDFQVQVDTDGVLSNPVATDIWSIINNPYHSMWQSIVMRINGTEVESTSSIYSNIKAFFTNKLNMSRSYKNCLGYNNSWVDDDVNKGEKCGATVDMKEIPDENWTEAGWKTNVLADHTPRYKANPDYNSGFMKRRKGLGTGRKVAFCTPVYHDVMTAGKSLPPETEIEFIFHRASDDFMFIKDPNVCNKNLKIVLNDLRLSYDYQVVTPEVQAAFKASKGKKKPKALVKKNIVKYYVCHKDDTELSRAGVFYTSQNNLPEQLILAFMPLSTWNGDVSKNSLDFPETLQFSEIGLVVNGWNEPSRFLNNNTDRGKVELYEHFLDNIGYSENRTKAEIPITYEEFYGGSFMIPFDRTAAKHNGFYSTLPDKGTMDIHLKLAPDTHLAENYVVIIFASYTEEMNIDEGHFYFTPLEAPAG